MGNFTKNRHWFYAFIAFIVFIVVIVVVLIVTLPTSNASTARFGDDQRRISMGDLKVNMKTVPGLSFLIRAKNEEENVQACLGSLTSVFGNNHLVEIIYVDNQSTDKTKEEVEKFTKLFSNVVLYSFDKELARCGKEHIQAFKGLINKSTITDYYNWVLDKATKHNVVKWDADFVANEDALKEMVDKHALLTRDDAFSLWFTGQTIFEDLQSNWYVNNKSYYNEYRCFSKKHGFKWEDNPKNPIWESPNGLFFRTHCSRYWKNSMETVLHGTCPDPNKYKGQDIFCGKGCEVYDCSGVFFEMKRVKKDEFTSRSQLLDKRDIQDNLLLNTLKEGKTHPDLSKVAFKYFG